MQTFSYGEVTHGHGTSTPLLAFASAELVTEVRGERLRKGGKTLST